jgi:hypothetical protein
MKTLFISICDGHAISICEFSALSVWVSDHQITRDQQITRFLSVLSALISGKI